MNRVLLWYGGRSQAIERLTARLAASLQRARPEITLAMIANAGNPHLQAMEGSGVEVHRIYAPSGLRAPLRVLMGLPRHATLLFRTLMAFRPDMVILTMNFALAWPLALACRLRRVPIVLLVHDAEPHAGDFAPLWQRISQALLIREAAALVALSQWTATRLTSSARPIVTWPINDFAREGQLLGRLRPAGAPMRFLFLGRMIAYKGLLTLFHACNQLQNRTDWRLTLAGDGPEGDWSRSAFRSFPQVDVSQIRTLSEEEVDAALVSHDVVVCPYTEATQSAVVSEALYASRPVIVARVGGLVEQVEPEVSGLVFAAADGNSLARAMSRFLDEDGLLERFAHGARESVNDVKVATAWKANIAALEAKLAQ